MMDLHDRSFKRAVFYFPSGSQEEIGEYIQTPEFRSPGVVRDIEFKFCGKKLKKSKEWIEFFEKIKPEFQEHCKKSEKGIDIQMCCDALKLATFSKIDRIFLLTNDSDFIPLCQTLKDFGVNVSLFHLYDNKNVNNELVERCDSYDCVPRDILNKIFIPPIV